MNKRAGIFIILVLALGAVSVFLSQEQKIFRAAIDPGYKDSRLSVEKRVINLLSQMTLDEKIGQMALVEKNSVHDIKDVPLYGLGGILSGAGGKPANNTPQGWLDMVTGYGEASRSSRLGIPVLYGVDAIHGHGNVPGATIFPHAIGLGAAHDRELVKKVAEATAEEVRATGIFWVFSPNLDAPEDIRWGRTYEAFSDDLEINADLGSAYVQGLQGAATDKVEMVATAKHYVGAGGMQWGSSSNKNFKIDQGTTKASEKTLREFYLPPFKAAVRAGVLSVMTGLNSWGDEKISANKYLITDILKKEIGFKGFVVSDWYGVYEIPGGEYTAAVTAINAGIDMVMLPYDYKTFIKNVEKAVRKGDIAEERINDAVVRILRAKFSVGLFEKTPEGNLEIIGSKEHRALAREAVSKSLVLLKNENQTLPLSSDVKRIFVAGSAAHNTGRQSGAWTIEWQGIDGNAIPGAISILEGIEKSAGSGTQIVYDANARFVADEDLADVGIAIVGEKPYAEGWGDNANPILSPEDLEIISLLRQTSKKLLVIIVSGRPLLLPDEMEQWDAIIAAWLPGSEGDGVAPVLFGKRSFSGKLPLPWPANLDQLPFSHEGKASDKTEPLFPKGFGL
ncbi:MAG: glycoside hydrolase family 3 protein [Patescibacteria group bacterium]